MNKTMEELTESRGLMSKEEKAQLVLDSLNIAIID